MKIIATRTFSQIIKKLHKNAKLDLDAAVKILMQNPLIGKT